MKRIRVGSPGKQRGLTMVIALVVVAVLLFVAVVLLTNAFGSMADETSIRAKIAAFDAAEAGINKAVAELDSTRGNSTECGPNGRGASGPALSDGGNYTWCIQWNGILDPKAQKPFDPRTGVRVNVPDGMVYAWSLGVAPNGGRGVLIEAMIAPSRGLMLPNGAINTGADVDVRGRIGIWASAPGAEDADIHSNGSILKFDDPEVVEGNTYAVGQDQVQGSGMQPHENQAPVKLPDQDQIGAAAQNARVDAQSGVAGILPSLSGNFMGNTFVNGDLDIDHGTVTFTRGQSVFINGNLCVSGQGRVINDGSTIWVAGTISTSGSGPGYSVAAGSTGMLVALGTDDGRPCGNSNGKFAVILDSGGTQAIGSVYSPNGSIEVTGTGVLVGRIVAGGNLDLDGSPGSGLQYDPRMTRNVPTNNFRVMSYMEY
jgi:type II secretory pathway pseudopilin PulG